MIEHVVSNSTATARFKLLLLDADLGRVVFTLKFNGGDMIVHWPMAENVVFKIVVVHA